VREVFGKDGPRHRRQTDRDHGKDKELQHISAAHQRDQCGRDRTDTEPQQHKAKRENLGDYQKYAEHEP
jgi:hypothetical protein